MSRILVRVAIVVWRLESAFLHTGSMLMPSVRGPQCRGRDTRMSPTGTQLACCVTLACPVPCSERTPPSGPAGSLWKIDSGPVATQRSASSVQRLRRQMRVWPGCGMRPRKQVSRLAPRLPSLLPSLGHSTVGSAI
eukprot:521956-Amphidinium_carterae.1